MSITLYAPDGSELVRKSEPEGRGFRILNTSHHLASFTSHLKGAEPKGWDHTLYLDMYYRHPTVNSAINKLVKSATNTGFEFVPRISREPVDESEVDVADAFFANQRDFSIQLRAIYLDLIIFGDAYMYIVPNRLRKPTRLKRLAPWTMHIAANEHGRVKYYVQYDIMMPSNDPVIFQPREIIHFKIPDPGNDLYGLSPLESLKETVAADLHMGAFQRNFFKNGALTGTFISMEDTSDGDVERARQFFADQHVGIDNAWRPILMAGKNVQITKGVASHEEMAFLEGRQFFIEEILSCLDVPPAKIGRMETANRSNAKEQDKSFRTESIAPLQNLVEEELNSKFMWGVLGLSHIKFQHSKSDTRDAQEQMDLLTAGLDKGVYSINEVRKMLGLPSVDGGDVPTVMTPTGAIPIDRFDLYFGLAASNIEDVPPHPRSPAAGEPIAPPPNTLSPHSDPANKSVGFAATRSWLAKSVQDARAMRQAYAYAVETDYPHALWQQMTQSIKKALSADDDDLRVAYIERAETMLAVMCEEAS